MKRITREVRKLLENEPVWLFFALRIALYALVATGLISSDPEDIEAILGVFTALLAGDTVSTYATRSQVFSPKTVLSLSSTSIGGFLYDTVLGLVPKGKVRRAFTLVSPLAARYGNRVLDGETRGMLQREVHEILRRNGILQGRDIPKP